MSVRTPWTTTIRKKCDSIEDAKTPFLWFVLTFLALVALRNFLEDFSDTHLEGPGSPAIFYAHTLAFYVFVILSFSLFFHAVTNRPVEKMMRLLIIGFAAMLLAPIVDLIVSKGDGYNMMYFMPTNTNNLLVRYLTFFGWPITDGVTLGQRVQIIVLLLGSVMYFRARNLSAVFTLLSTIVLYTLIFLYASAPYFVLAIGQLFNVHAGYSNQIMINFYLVLNGILAIIALWRWNPSVFRALGSDMRITRQLIALVMFVLGVVIAMRQDVLRINGEELLAIGVALFSIFFALLFAIISNNMIDVGIDAISNAKRPLIRKTIDVVTYRAIGWSSLLLSMLYAMSQGRRAFMVMAAFNGSFLIYSLPPLRLKRVPVLSKMSIAFNLLLISWWSYMIVGGIPLQFPLVFSALLFLSMTLLFNVIDIKDEAGDKAYAIATIPVLFGLKRSKMIIGLIFLGACILLPLAMNDLRILPIAAILGVTGLTAIVREKYNDAATLSVMIIAFILFTFYIAFGGMDRWI